MQGHKLNTTQAYCRILEAGCEALEGSETPAPAQSELSEIAEIASKPLAKLADISGDDISVPGYGFPEDEEEIPAPASPTNGTHVPAPAPTAQPAIPLALEPAPTTAPPVAVPQAAETPSSKRPAPKKQSEPVELSADIIKIAEARAQYDRMSERTFAQLLFDRGIYRHRAKDGSEVRIPHTTLREWLQRARDAGVL